MKNNEHPGTLNATVLLLWLTAAVIAPYESEGVYFALIGGNHVMHFRQSYWKKLVRGTISMWRHIDVHVIWRKGLTYGHAHNAINIP